MGRVGWILAGGAALVAGMIYQGTINLDMGDDHRPTVIVDTKGDSRAEARENVARGRAEAKLATIDITGDTPQAEIDAARAERDRAQAEVHRLEAAMEARRDAVDRDQLRDEIRTEVREAIRN